MIFKICENCGAYLDAGEVCDCTYEEKDSAAESEEKEKHPVKRSVSLSIN